MLFSRRVEIVLDKNLERYKFVKINKK